MKRYADSTSFVFVQQQEERQQEAVLTIGTERRVRPLGILLGVLFSVLGAVGTLFVLMMGWFVTNFHYLFSVFGLFAVLFVLIMYFTVPFPERRLIGVFVPILFSVIWAALIFLIGFHPSGMFSLDLFSMVRLFLAGLPATFVVPLGVKRWVVTRFQNDSS